MRAVHTDSSSDIDTSITFSEDLNNVSANTEKKNAYSLFPHKELTHKSRIFAMRRTKESLFFVVSSVADDLTKLVLVVLM